MFSIPGPQASTVDQGRGGPGAASGSAPDASSLALPTHRGDALRGRPQPLRVIHEDGSPLFLSSR